MSAAKLNIDELEAGYPLFCKALRLLILKGNSVKDIEKETVQVLKNLAEVLKAGGAKIEDVIKTTIYLTDLSNFKIVNKIYSDFFNIENPPARACVEVSSLPKGVLVEIDCVAFLD